MSYQYKLSGYWRLKEPGVYPWPCEPLPDRTIELFADDVFTRAPDGSFTKHTGLMTLNHQIPLEKMEYVEADANLTVGWL